MVVGSWWLGVGQAAERADFGCGELGSKMGDGLFAVALGLGRHAAATYENKIGDIGRAGARPSQVDDLVSGGAVAGFEIKRFGSIEAAAECDERNFHLLW